MILIIDDDSAVRSSLSFMLKRAGYEAQVVPGPREAIEVVRTVAPDLILMDMNFTLSTTGEEGLTLLKQVKVFRPDTPVILMTACGRNGGWICICRPEEWLRSAWMEIRKRIICGEEG
jgi:two-component system NtrC family response regulator